MKKVYRFSLERKKTTVFLKKNYKEYLSELLLNKFSDNNFSGVIYFDKKLKTRANLLKVDLEKNGAKVLLIPAPSGEKSKDIDQCVLVLKKMFRFGIHRKSFFITLGGGSVGDSGGWIASQYQRGIAWINIPTTLLSLVDSAYGGKTALNFDDCKNIIGSIYQPEFIFIDLSFICTLSYRECYSALGEVFKYGFIFDYNFLIKVFEKKDKLLKRNETEWRKVILSCLSYKMDLVLKDEKDDSGIREQLNLGHTFAHGLEGGSNLKIPHGLAVVYGLLFSIHLSYLRGKISLFQRDEYLNFLSDYSFNDLKKNISKNKVWNSMKKDKKNKGQGVKVLGLARIGKVISIESVQKKEFDLIWRIL
ncbi:MAG: hypothetical protein CL678_02825 [Bdellovibrionaceae bacterium]|nr:hypothetical protein [Pseudobdellovibrionaceae bacterium]|tara:strand:+ start:755 stop:1840 length:1086 start_codon:yes stop_codon:yes gene_type:complete